MDISYLSPSRANVYLDCPFRYLLQYHLKLPELGLDTIATKKGSCVHEVLENYANGSKDYTAGLINYYEKSKLWELDNRKPNRGFPHPQIKNCGECKWATTSGNSTICGIAKRATTDFEGCPKPNFEDDLKLTESLLNRPKSPLGPKVKIIGAEVPFEQVFGKIKLKGFIDLITEIDSTTLEVRDYKTGTFTKNTDEAFKDLQMRTYSLVAKKLYPQYSFVVMTLDYLRKTPITVCFDEEDDAKTLKFLEEIYDRIVNETNPIQRKSFKCSWCVGFDECSKIKASYTKNGKFQMPDAVNAPEKIKEVE